MDRLYIKEFYMKSEITGETYIRDLPVVRALRQIGRFTLRKPVTFFVGENGSGKSTLLEALAVSSGLNAEGGSRNFNFSTKSTESDLHNYISIAKSAHEKDRYFLRAESFYNVASNIEDLDEGQPSLIMSYGGKSLHEQSHGESFMSLLTNRFGGNGLYILDEPEAALSPTRQMSLLVEIHRLVNTNSQLIISTHSPILTAYPNAEIYEIRDDTISLTEYKAAEHYQITKQFLNNSEQMLKILLE